MTTNNVETMIARHIPETPTDLHQRTVLAVGAADRIGTADSPVGPVWLAWSPRGITAVTPMFADATIDDFLAHHRREGYGSELPRSLRSDVEDALASGRTDELEVDMSGIGDYQRSVLAACQTIPVGQVRPYGWIAEEIGNPGSVRAVGTALGRNPIPLVVPCHRVVRSDGSIGQYAFGPEMKEALLRNEGAIL